MIWLHTLILNGYLFVYMHHCVIRVRQGSSRYLQCTLCDYTQNVSWKYGMVCMLTCASPPREQNWMLKNVILDLLIQINSLNRILSVYAAQILYILKFTNLIIVIWNKTIINTEWKITFLKKSFFPSPSSSQILPTLLATQFLVIPPWKKWKSQKNENHNNEWKNQHSKNCQSVTKIPPKYPHQIYFVLINCSWYVYWWFKIMTFNVMFPYKWNTYFDHVHSPSIFSRTLYLSPQSSSSSVPPHICLWLDFIYERNQFESDLID